MVESLRSMTGTGTQAASEVTAAELLQLFDAQVVSRHLDLTQRWLQRQGEAYYTIGSAGHESNAAVAMALRPTDPALLHYRSGGFYVARAAQREGSTPVDDVLLGSMAATGDRISGGRHKVFGNADLAVIPQTSTIGSHAPRAFGLAFAIGRGSQVRFPDDAVVVCSVGDASINHSTTLGALNATSYCATQGLPVPLLVVCEDNGLGISTRTPEGWVERRLTSLPGIAHHVVDGDDPERLLLTCRAAADHVRTRRAPAVVHLRTVRFLGHAGSDAEIAYRSPGEILHDYGRDPLLATARALVARGAATGDQLLQHYERVRTEVEGRARELVGSVRRLDSAAAVMAPLTWSQPEQVLAATTRVADDRAAAFDGELPEDSGPLTLAQSINAALRDTMAARPETLVFGEDVAVKGGVYGVTRGLRRTFGARRVFDTLLDEQTILGTALGAALAGALPIPEIQYLAYLHNAEDQLRGEAASLRFFSAGQYQNGLVVRVAGLAYQRGFGGHFHNDNSLAVLRDVPGLVCAVPSSAAAAPALLRSCVALAAAEERVCVFVEPIALYHERDLHEPGDGLLLASYAGPSSWEDRAAHPGEVRQVERGGDLLIVTFGNGVRMSQRAARRLAGEGIGCSVVDLQWVAPLPAAAVLEAAREHPAVLVVDETRDSGGVGEGVVTALVTGGYRGAVGRVASRDSYVPLGPAADHVLLSEGDIVRGARELLERT